MYIEYMKRLILLSALLLPLFIIAQRKTVLRTSVLVIGGGVGGTAAAIQSARMGVKTILVEPTALLGGMLTAAGVSCTDGNDQLPSGIWEEFRQALYKHYGRSRLNTGWVSNTNFEPGVGDSILKSLAAKQKDLTVLFGYEMFKVHKQNNKLTGADFIGPPGKLPLTIHSTVVIDATELGDVFAAAGATYDLGMDDPLVSGEKEAREKNDIIQDLTWAAILKDFGPGADRTIAQPEGYDPSKYYCCCTDAPCESQPWNGDKLKMLNYGKLPRSPGATAEKYMLNWPPHGNDIYLNVVEDDPETRRKKYVDARQHTLGFIYFMQTVLGMKNIGLADDELDNGLAWIPYNREGRRVKGIVRMNINHIRDPYAFTLYRTGVAVGDYPVDHHHARFPGKVPEIEFPPIPSYSIPLGTLIPEKLEGLVVCEKGISVTNIVNGTTRLQPVVMLTGQAAGVLAALSVLQKKKIREVAVRAVQAELLKAKCYLAPFVDVRPQDPHWASIQRVGVTGILRGAGVAQGWSNKTFFYPDSTVSGREFIRGLRQFASVHFNSNRLGWREEQLIADCFRSILRFRPYFKAAWFRELRQVHELKPHWKNWGLENFDPDRPITRKELAVMLDQCLLLFGSKNVVMDMNGKLNFFVTQF
jgi:hypothetical protein